MRVFPLLATTLFGLMVFSSATRADDWPRWLGANSDSRWNETGIVETLPEGQLPKKWSAPCSWGYAGPAVADGKVFVFDYEIASGQVVNMPSRREKLTGEERVVCLDAATGNELWTKGSEVEYLVSYPGGPRATPAVDGEHIYTLGAMGDLTCRRVSDGEVVWHVNFTERFGGETPVWGHSSAPLVEGDVVVVAVGAKDAGIVAFDKMTGETKWKALSLDEPGYCGPITLEIDGQKQIVAFHPLGVTAFEPTTGATRWEMPIKPNFGMSTSPPRRQGDQLFVSTYGNSLMLELESPTSAKALWRGKPRNAVYTSNAPSIFTPDAIYGCDVESSQLTAVDPKTAERLWETAQPILPAGTESAGRGMRHGTAFLVQHAESGNYFLFNEAGELIIARLTPQAYEEISRAKVVEPTNEAFGRKVVWTHPAFANKSIFARNDKEIVCVDLAK